MYWDVNKLRQTRDLTLLGQRTSTCWHAHAHCTLCSYK